MKTILLFTCAIFFGITSSLAQNSLNLIVFSEGGEQFYLVVNGIRQNANPETNVKVTDLNSTSLSVKVVFANTEIPSITQNGGLFEFGNEYTLMVKQKRKGGYALRYFGEVPVSQSKTSGDMAVISYHTEPLPETSVSTTTGTTGDVAVSTGTDMSTSGTTTTTTHSTTTTTSGTGMNVNINDGETNTDVSVGMSVGESGININISDNMGDMGMGSTGTSTTTTTTTTSVTTSGTSTGTTDVIMVDEPVETVVYVDGYTGSIGCAIPESSAASIKGAIENENFKADKIMVAKQATKNKCLTVSQIIDISNAFDFENNKLEFAKYAYDRTYDKDNYYQVNQIFDFASNKRALNDYISGR